MTGDTLVDDEVVGFSLDISLTDSSEQKAGDCVLSCGKGTSSPMIAISLLPSAFLKVVFMLFVYNISINYSSITTNKAHIPFTSFILL